MKVTKLSNDPINFSMILTNLCSVSFC